MCHIFSDEFNFENYFSCHECGELNEECIEVRSYIPNKKAKASVEYSNQHALDPTNKISRSVATVSKVHNDKQRSSSSYLDGNKNNKANNNSTTDKEVTLLDSLVSDVQDVVGDSFLRENIVHVINLGNYDVESVINTLFAGITEDATFSEVARIEDINLRYVYTDNVIQNEYEYVSRQVSVKPTIPLTGLEDEPTLANPPSYTGPSEDTTNATQKIKAKSLSQLLHARGIVNDEDMIDCTSMPVRQPSAGTKRKGSAVSVNCITSDEDNENEVLLPLILPRNIIQSGVSTSQTSSTTNSKRNESIDAATGDDMYVGDSSKVVTTVFNMIFFVGIS